jgi:hypothetical protein
MRRGAVNEDSGTAVIQQRGHNPQATGRQQIEQRQGSLWRQYTHRLVRPQRIGQLNGPFQRQRTRQPAQVVLG